MNKINLPVGPWTLGFDLAAEEGDIFDARLGGMPAAHAEFRGGALVFQVWYHTHDEPCVLRAAAKPGDRIRLRSLGYRLELSADGRICDEDWPWGEALLQDASAELVRAPAGLTVRAAPETADIPPAVTGRFRGAEGWHPEENVWVGDCMPFSRDGVYHVFYLKDRRHHHSKWGKGAHQWAHISSRNLIDWEIHPMAVEIDDMSEGSICTGSVVYANGVYSAYYSIRAVDGSAAPLCRSVSRDGFHFKKDTMRLSLSGKYNLAAVRDPKVFADENGLFHMFVTTSVRCGGSWQGCLAHLTSKDLEDWREEPEPALLTEVYEEGCAEPWCIEPECSDYFAKDGRYYLIARSHYWISEKPFGPWRQPAESLIPCGSVPKMAFWQGGRVIFTGFKPVGGYAGTMTFMEALTNADGTLRFIPVPEMQDLYKPRAE